MLVILLKGATLKLMGSITHVCSFAIHLELNPFQMLLKFIFQRLINQTLSYLIYNKRFISASVVFFQENAIFKSI